MTTNGMSFAAKIAKRVKSAMEDKKATVTVDADDVNVDTEKIAKDAIDHVLAEEHLRAFASLVEMQEPVVERTDNVGAEVQAQIESQMQEIMKEIRGDVKPGSKEQTESDVKSTEEKKQPA